MSKHSYNKQADETEAEFIQRITDRHGNLEFCLIQGEQKAVYVLEWLLSHRTRLTRSDGYFENVG